MTIHEATGSYEQWLRNQLTNGAVIDDEAIAFKAEAMKKSAFPFLRATFYRWAQRWGSEAGALGAAPRVLAVGDLHVENFGTWRDKDGRRIWGINDFDEAAELPWTSDLVRLGVSAALAVRGEGVEITREDLCALLLSGYEAGMVDLEGSPFDLDGGHPRLGALVKTAEKPVGKFWEEFDTPGSKWKPVAGLPAAAQAVLESVEPSEVDAREFREQRGPYDGDENKPSGLGSLGRPRVCAVLSVHGGREVREAKAMIASAVHWARGEEGAEIAIPRLLQGARRRSDPFFAIKNGWAARRIAPDAVKIAFKKLKKDGVTDDDRQTLFRSMGTETANIHLGSETRGDVLADLRSRNQAAAGWFLAAVNEWEERVVEDFEAFATAETGNESRE